MNDLERAEEHLRTIRRLMERGTIYRAISAPVALVGGILSVILGLYQQLHPIHHESPVHFALPWLVVLAITGATNAFFITLSAMKRQEPVFSASMKAATLALAPPLVVAAVLTCCLILSPRLDNKDMRMAILWVICYGLGLLATAHFAPRSLKWLGRAFLASGLAVVLGMVLASGTMYQNFEHPGAPLLMAATFGLYHLAYALCAWPRKVAEPET